MIRSLAFLALTAVVACSPPARVAHPTHLGPRLLRGESLAVRTLALTFDDGPGSRTLELSAYLRDQGVRAAFFVNGHCFEQPNPCGNRRSADEVLGQLVADGHLVGNHTQHHPHLTDLTRFAPGPAGDEAIVRELSRTDSIIAPHVQPGLFFFRPPYGEWDARDVAALSRSPMAKYIGPVDWDIGGAMTGARAAGVEGGFGADWDCWGNRHGYGVQTTHACAERYLNEVDAVGRGIVLMHDSDRGDVANHDAESGAGNTVDMVRLTLPRLQQQGYRFVRLDEVPGLRGKASRE